MENHKLSNLTDPQLYSLCKEYGTNARIWLRKFAGLLPEVKRRRLYKKRGYASLYEFAAKLAGMSNGSVDKILRISKKMEGLPVLRKYLEEGAVGWSKLEKVAYVADAKTEKFWAEKLTALTARSLEAYIQEWRKQNAKNNRLKFTHVSKFTGKNQPGFSIHNINPELEKKLRLLKQAFEKEKGEALGWNETLSLMVAKLETSEITRAAKPEKRAVVRVCPDCVKKRMDLAEKEDRVARYIPTEAKKVIAARSGGTCEFPGCRRAGEIFHHTRRYALKKNHDPGHIVYLCTAHEGILQAGLVAHEEKEPKYWILREGPEFEGGKMWIDENVALYRKEPTTQT